MRTRRPRSSCSAVAAAIAFLAVAALHAQDYRITIATPPDVAAKRRALVHFIWGTEGFPSAQLPQVIPNIPSPIGAVRNVRGIDLLRIGNGRAIYFVPERSNGTAVVVHQGHAETLDTLRTLIAALLDHGYAVVAVYMPHFREAIPLGGGRIEPADNAGPQPRRHAGVPIRAFVDPAIISINYLESLKRYSAIHMIGLSGGGWTTTLCAAIDPRIRLSISIAGTIPLYLRNAPPGGSWGDAEQHFGPLYAIAGFPDLYVLGAYGAGREQIQLLNRYDDCCFGGAPILHDAGTPEKWEEEVRAYQGRVRGALHRLGGGGSFRVIIDPALHTHGVPLPAISGTILPDLATVAPPAAAAPLRSPP